MMHPTERTPWLERARLLWPFVALSFALGLDADATAAPVRPNIMLVISDDLNTGIGCYGDARVKTPQLDRLAARGVRFERAYCQFPLCSPSRTSFLSGRRPETTRIIDNRTLPRTYLGDTPFLPEYFRRHGYFTARLGKVLHDSVRDEALGRTQDDPALWDLAVDELAEAARQKGAERVLHRQRFAGHGDPQEWSIVDGPDEAQGDAVIAQRTAGLLAQRRDQPFFIVAGLRRPHVPFIAPKRFFDLYPPASISLPATPVGDRDDIPSIALTHAPGDEALSEEDNRKIIAAYYASISFMDAQVGVILDALDRAQRWDDTVVVFMSDHGFHLGEHGGLWRKRTLFEEATRVPLIVAAPGVRAGRVSPRLVELVDLFPTLTELAGLPGTSGLEGTSFVPLLAQPARVWKNAAFTSVIHQPPHTLGRSLRTERYRYTEWGDDSDAIELYDLQTDPREHRNLARYPEHADMLEELRHLLKKGWRGALPPPALENQL